MREPSPEEIAKGLLAASVLDLEDRVQELEAELAESRRSQKKSWSLYVRASKRLTLLRGKYHALQGRT